MNFFEVFFIFSIKFINNTFCSFCFLRNISLDNDNSVYRNVEITNKLYQFSCFNHYKLLRKILCLLFIFIPKIFTLLDNRILFICELQLHALYRRYFLRRLGPELISQHSHLVLKACDFRMQLLFC